VVLGEDRRVHADGAPAEILGNRDLLIAANLIHEHLHEHGGVRHSHPHAADEPHVDGHLVDGHPGPGDLADDPLAAAAAWAPPAGIIEAPVMAPGSGRPG
jgi:hypothetical protein